MVNKYFLEQLKKGQAVVLYKAEREVILTYLKEHLPHFAERLKSIDKNERECICRII